MLPNKNKQKKAQLKGRKQQEEGEDVGQGVVQEVAEDCRVPSAEETELLQLQ